MDNSNYHDLIQRQRNYFRTGETLPLAFRLAQLRKFKAALKHYQPELLQALNADLNRSDIESLATEFSMLYDEIEFITRKLWSWMKPLSVGARFPSLWPGQAKIYHDPYGVVLILSAWNFPLLLSFAPLIGAICAGNTVILKPSELSTATEKVILELITKTFPPEYIAAIHADADETSALLTEHVDYIFYTGGARVGKIIMQAAATHLTPVTLELGGKNPCIVDETANLEYAARRIMWGKTLNAGQGCLAPDILFIHSSRKIAFVTECVKVLTQFFGADIADSPDYCRIINTAHYERLKGLLHEGRILAGGQFDDTTRFIAPTFLDQFSETSTLMQEEIFGPLLPIVTFEHIDEVISFIHKRPKPLALYYFTNDRSREKRMLEHVSFGGGCINDCVVHIVNYHAPFGGVGQSGMGSYHGHFSFKTFSHAKSIYKRTHPFDLSLQYPPFSLQKSKWFKRLLRIKD